MSASTVPVRYDLDRVRYVTAHFLEMQGLRLVPFGVTLLAFSAVAAGLVPFGRWGGIAVVVAAPVLAWLASRRIGGHYDRQFGRVQPSRSGLARGAIVSTALGATAGFLDSHLRPTVSVPALLLAAVMVHAWYGGMRGQRLHYVALAVFFLVLGVSPLFGPAPASRVSFATLLLAFGIAAIVLGVCNHVALEEALRPLPATDDDRPV